jgi:hypothetical protein
VWVSCLLARFTGISLECHRNVAGKSPGFRRNIESEHLKKGDNHNSAFPQTHRITEITVPCFHCTPLDNLKHDSGIAMILSLWPTGVFTNLPKLEKWAQPLEDSSFKGCFED